jgi:hypothetical protein
MPTATRQEAVTAAKVVVAVRSEVASVSSPTPTTGMLTPAKPARK